MLPCSHTVLTLFRSSSSPIIYILFLLPLLPHPSAACSDCGDGMMGGSPMMMSGGSGGSGSWHSSPSWSTSWTQKPWSWSQGAWGGDSGGMVTSPLPPPTMEESKDDAESADGNNPKSQGGTLLERFCARHPESPKCAENQQKSGEQTAENGNAEVQGHEGKPKEFDDFATFGWNSASSPPGTSFHQHPFPPGDSSPTASSSSSPTSFGRSYMRPSMDEGVQPETPSLSFGYLSDEAREAMLKNCKDGVVDCKAQPFGMIQKKQMVLQYEMDFIRKVRPYQSGEMVEKRVELVQELKKKMIRVAGLEEHIEPVNDGTFQHDVLLTEQQSEELIKALDNVPKPSKQQRYGYGSQPRNRRASLFLDQLTAQRWPIGQPIPYFFDPKIEEFEKQMVRQAHQMIEAQTCIRFQAAESKPNSDFLFYIKVATPTFCGLSYIGHITPANPIYLSFQCQDPVGVAAHETLHALGANHEHLRVDRDEYLDIQWSNINPQFYDFFAIADPSKFTPYGIPYAYDSIMHYGPYTASLGPSRPTMVPRQNPQQNQGQMGQRKRLSARDVELLNAMYCKQAGCEDSNVYCGVWALRNFCRTAPQMMWMRQNCRKSCKMC